MADYATFEDLQKHWPDLPDDQLDEAKQKILEAHIEVRGLYPTLDNRVQSGELSADVVKLVICRMVKRALRPVAEGMEGVSSVQQSQGGFSQSLTFAGSGDGDLYLKKADKRLLGGRDGGTVFSVIPGGAR